MADKKETKEINAPKLELSEGDIKITGEELDLGFQETQTNMRIKNPVISIPYNKEVLDDLISAALTPGNLYEKESRPEDVVKLFKKNKELYKNYKQEESKEE